MTATQKVNLEPGCDELEWFLTCFNLAYPDWEIRGDASRELTEDDIEIIDLRSYWGRCGVSSTGTVRIGLNRREIRSRSPEWGIGLICHELAHVKHHDHSPAFWELALKVCDRLADRQSKVEAAVRTGLDWAMVEEFLIEDPKSSTVDGRSETVYGRRKKNAVHFGRHEAVKPFDGVQYWNKHHPSKEKVSAEQIIDPIPTLEEVEEWLEPPRRNAGVKIERGRFVVEPPLVIDDGGEYRFADESSMYRYAFIYYDSDAQDDAHHPVVPSND